MAANKVRKKTALQRGCNGDRLNYKKLQKIGKNYDVLSSVINYLYGVTKNISDKNI